jgi:thermitase
MKVSGNGKRTSVLLTGAAAALMAGFSISAQAAEYIVKFKNSAEAVAAFNQESIGEAAVSDLHEAGSLVTVRIDNKNAPEKAARQLVELMARPDVEYVVENAPVHMLGMPNDPRVGEQWSLAKVNAGAAWDRTVGSRSVVVAVIDTGIDATHPDLKDNMWKNNAEIAGNGVDDDNNGYVDDTYGWDFLDNDKDPADVTSSQNPGHGTHCAGIVGATGDNGVGISGMSQQVSMMALRFIGPNGQGDLMGAIKAIDYAIANKADIISASWGAKVPSSQATPLIEAIGRANDAGVIFVAAAANDGANNDTTSMYPANAEFPNMIAVAASDNSDAKPSWSNYGKAKVALASPGHNILSTLPNNTYGNLSGTSMATPMVAGLVALLQSEAKMKSGKGLTGAEMRSLLQTTGTKVQIETACDCRIDALAAVEALNASKLVVVPAAATFAPNSTGKFAAIGGNGGYQFFSMNPGTLEVNADGSFTAKAEGETTIKVTDSSGTQAQSLAIRVAVAQQGGGGEECPLPDPMMCQLMCLIDPTLPWCAK